MTDKVMQSHKKLSFDSIVTERSWDSSMVENWAMGWMNEGSRPGRV
jgi:hypothetical protein